MLLELFHFHFGQGAHLFILCTQQGLGFLDLFEGIFIIASLGHDGF